MKFEQKSDTIRKMATFLAKLKWLLGELVEYYRSSTKIIYPQFFHDNKDVYTEVKAINASMFSAKKGTDDVLIKVYNKVWRKCS